MAKLEFKVGDNHWTVDATTYGVDIFAGGIYLHTIQSDNKQTRAYWLGKGVEYVMNKELSNE
jgi:hypothetical protein